MYNDAKELPEEIFEDCTNETRLTSLTVTSSLYEPSSFDFFVCLSTSGLYVEIFGSFRKTLLLTYKMTSMITTSFKNNIWAVIQFITAEGSQSMEIYTRM